MINKTELKEIVEKLYDKPVSYKISGHKLIIKPSEDNAELPELKDVRSCEFFGLKNLEELIEESDNWFTRNYFNWHPIAKIKNWLLLKKGVKLDQESVVVSPYSTIGSKGKFKDKLLDPLRKVIIGKQTFFGGWSKIKTHHYNREKKSLEVGPVIIGNKCLVGAFSTIYPGSIMKDNSLLGVREELRGVIERNEVVSHSATNDDLLPEPLIKERYKLYRISKQVLNRLRRTSYKGEKVYISKKGIRLYITPRNEWKNSLGECTKESLREAIMGNDPALSCTFTALGSSWKRSLWPQNTGKILWSIITGRAVKKIRNRWLYRLIGVKVGKGTTIGNNPYVEFVNPDLTTIGRNVKIGNNAIIANHYYIEGRTNGFVTGINHISDEAEISDGMILLPGTYVGKGVKIDREYLNNLLSRDASKITTLQGVFL